MSNVLIREAAKSDMSAVHELVKELAEYEKAADQVKTTVDDFVKDGFEGDPTFGCYVAEMDQKVVGFALYYIRYSTWNGKVLYLEDLLVTEECRGKGVGKLLFEKMIELGREKGFRDLNWQVLDWNEPAINFYKKYDVMLDPEWINGKIVL